MDSWQFIQKEVPKPSPEPQQPQPVPTAIPQQNTPSLTPTSSTAPSQANTKLSGLSKTKILSVKKKGSKNCSIKLKKVKNAAGYQILYSTNKSFKKNVKKITSKSVTCTVKKLKHGKKYYFKARAYAKSSSGKTIYGAYSSIKGRKF